MSRYYKRGRKPYNRQARVLARYDAVDNLIDLIVRGEEERRYRGRKSAATIQATDAAYSLVLCYMGIGNGGQDEQSLY